MDIKRIPVVVLLLQSLAACAAPAGAPHADRLAADCPADLPRLVDLRNLEPAPVVDVRYATTDNFTGAPLPGYETARALLRPEPAEALRRVERRLRDRGLGLKAWDAYRPVRATLAMVDWAERTGNEWVLDQGYVARRSGHNRGGTVDLTVIDLESGQDLDMGTAYDTFSEAAHTANAAGDVRRNRELLVEMMAAEGFENYDREWWHFSWGGDYEPLDVPLGCFARP